MEVSTLASTKFVFIYLIQWLCTSHCMAYPAQPLIYQRFQIPKFILNSRYRQPRNTQLSNYKSPSGAQVFCLEQKSKSLPTTVQLRILNFPAQKVPESDTIAAVIERFPDWFNESSTSRKHQLTIQQSGNNLQRYLTSRTRAAYSIHSVRSTVSALQNQKCPENHVRVASGECKRKVNV